jgi:8-oxo-dGTP pyrophosphatase MutT (NUDIX family)
VQDKSSKLIKVAVCMAVLDANDKLLITRRCKNLKYFPSCWVMPGGHLDPQEDLEVCGLRELREEAGIDITYTEGTYQYDGEEIGKLESFYAFESASPGRNGPESLPGT